MVAKYLSTKVFINHRGKKRSFTTKKPGRHRPGQRTKGNLSSTGTNETRRRLIASQNRAWLLRPPPWSKHWTAALCMEPHRPPSPRTPHRYCRHSLSHLRAGGMTTGSAVPCRGPGLGKHWPTLTAGKPVSSSVSSPELTVQHLSSTEVRKS